MIDQVIKLLVAGGVMGALDFVWLGFVAKKLYAGEIGKILLDKPNMLAALIFYAIYIVGVVVFVVNPAISKNSLTHALVYGAFFGFVAYATYDLTSLAVIKGFTTKVVIIDLIWGTLLTAVVATITFAVIQKWFA